MTVSLIGAAGLVSVGLGNAQETEVEPEPVSLELDYECPFPLIGTHVVEVEINAEIPLEIEVGEPSPEFAIDTISTAPPDATAGMRLVGAETIEGSAVAHSAIDAPEAVLDLMVPADIPQQPIPEEGPSTIEAFGTAPSVTFTEPGEAVITVGDLDLTLTPRDGDGNETGLGTFDSDCTQLPDQDNVLAAITIQPEDVPPPPEPEVPVVVDHAFEVEQDSVLEVAAPGVLEGATPEGVDLTAAVEQEPASGALELAGDGSFTYEPESGFVGED
ncbi:DUF6801 domain-containing protein, partial [Haloechinothrix sp. LS1_15]|uniref:DUF6801 domain-containing protein n=1 Tax=Haloechinothrix sp. LS1_15 TaxID=2652248 RepID=UPI00294AEF29